MGDFNPWRTLLEPHFIIPESLVASCAVVFARIVNEQTNNEQTNKLNYIYRLSKGDRGWNPWDIIEMEVPSSELRTL